MQSGRITCLALVSLFALAGTGCSPGGTDSAAAGAADTAGAGAAAAADLPACDPDDGGLELPGGFCALVVAKDLPAPRHLAVADNGDVYAASDEGGVVALRDTTGDGKADVRQTFGEGEGTGVALYEDWIYFGADDRIVRWPREAGTLAPTGDPQVVVRGLPSERSHAAKPLAFDDSGHLYVNVGSPSNSCQEQDRAVQSPGQDPCPELERRAGIWRFDAERTGQTQADGERFATGLRNTVALAWGGPDDELYGVVHGRDQFLQSWPDLYSATESAELPSEEFVRIQQGDDFGWPYCYHDWQQEKKLLAPEYGGDKQTVGRCADKKDPILAFPGHWGPNGLLFYGAGQFPASYRGDAFIAFHGSWNRAPRPQEGYRVVHVPFENGSPTGRWNDFATGFRQEGQGPAEADHRPTGLDVGPDGSLYVSDDQAGWVWRIVHRGS